METHAIALRGQWEGLRAFPRALRSPDHRKRLETGLERLGGLYEQMAARAALLAAGMERLNGLRAGMIDQLDATDADADFEPSVCHPAAHVGSDHLDDLEDDRSDFEPSLCGLGCNCVIGGGDDLEDVCEDEGADESDEAVDDRGEPSLVTLMTTPADQSGSRWIGSFDSQDNEDDADHEPSLCGVHMTIAGAYGTYHGGQMHHDLEGGDSNDVESGVAYA